MIEWVTDVLLSQVSFYRKRPERKRHCGEAPHLTAQFHVAPFLSCADTTAVSGIQYHLSNSSCRLRQLPIAFSTDYFGDVFGITLCENRKGNWVFSPWAPLREFFFYPFTDCMLWGHFRPTVSQINSDLEHIMIINHVLSDLWSVLTALFLFF